MAGAPGSSIYKCGLSFSFASPPLPAHLDQRENSKQTEKQWQMFFNWKKNANRARKQLVFDAFAVSIIESYM